jgi:hypothetical protein
MTYFGHMAPKPPASKLRGLADQGRLALKAIPRRVDTTGNWLRFPFYHHVFDDERRGFAHHLDTMRDYGEFIGLDDAVRLITAGVPLDGRYLCLSFDDGFRCGLTHALPILAERSVPAAFFIVSGLVPDRATDCTAEHRRFFGPQRRPVPFLTWDDWHDHRLPQRRPPAADRAGRRRGPHRAGGLQGRHRNRTRPTLRSLLLPVGQARPRLQGRAGP